MNAQGKGARAGLARSQENDGPPPLPEAHEVSDAESGVGNKPSATQSATQSGNRNLVTRSLPQPEVSLESESIRAASL